MSSVAFAWRALRNKHKGEWFTARHCEIKRAITAALSDANGRHDDFIEYLSRIPRDVPTCGGIVETDKDENKMELNQ